MKLKLYYLKLLSEHILEKKKGDPIIKVYDIANLTNENLSFLDDDLTSSSDSESSSNSSSVDLSYEE